VGYLSEHRDLPAWMRVDELLRYTRAFYPGWDDRYAEELRLQFGLDSAARVRNLSQGQQAKAAFVRNCLCSTNPVQASILLSAETSWKPLFARSPKKAAQCSSPRIFWMKSSACQINWL
jgi:hypothetical protein